ncbi:Metallo-beta-lactamase L1 type 3 [Usitatibacter rugosus]|uniref:Metallo-beta-lactamase L1 type 3 n=2 Tax=Usitatibacter rugosus TaxID=2732067 RepID=A0A6M4GPI3_9PROT|nr:Metallo-beta-lactamase L1 type 3 [Usitatibacter rugosus]
MVLVGSLSAPGYRLIANPKYPDIVKDFEHGFAVVEALPCEIALAPHPGMVSFWQRVAKRDQGDADALMDSTVCRAYAKDARESFAKELKKQQ